ncbi:hypothetical protein N864_24165 [Intrasporangium chromatireducens Q5-1]|uniref:DUF1648 domain-containing protein n=1 Tax=Intrasporangium chromatireducens Q5-1 TaxID=584657 RepID=W9GQF9_9MICO|nr:DUF1648 domain-containing protein [Intrasporangium chromatireducens]EWT06104.1 hypothetical protein N864_24165 [Intrasporangium chromatireducens Q5-1]
MRTGLARLFWGLGVLYAALVVWAALVLPDRVPAHWGSAAPPDRWAGRTETIVMFALLGIVMVGIFAVLLALVSRNSSLTWVNLPNKQFWQRPENLPSARRRLAVDVTVLGCLAVAFSCAVPVSVVLASHTPGGALPSWTAPVLVAWVCLTLGYSIWMSTVRWRVPPAGSGA